MTKFSRAIAILLLLWICILDSYAYSKISTLEYCSVKGIKLKLSKHINRSQTRSLSEILKLFIALSFAFEGYANSNKNIGSLEEEQGFEEKSNFAIAAEHASIAAYLASNIDEANENFSIYCEIRNRAYLEGSKYTGLPIQLMQNIDDILVNSLRTVYQAELMITQEQLLHYFDALEVIQMESNGELSFFLTPFTEIMKSYIDK